ncbi:MAG: manganese efflux pump [Pelotomaculum sp.]|uniref:Manganese exporter MntP n=1 Tax=Pelotomaculum thermopropionicum (strain DSM 13744 / JCM 10971 / SI) TaxID=370438 RepID=MNTP_PELTS|nr:RecName: Full=Putative manganese efflux pump MntP [Pelotomaculum thermopropionicum SI]NPV74691.1 manganese efflux pump [Pelotomaculum sp.]BAF61008.1 predicted membrane protein [Pelotomaculum thermopropionicum SI]
MSFFTLMALAVALGTDALSLSVGIGLTGISRRRILQISATVLLFHIFMPLTGWLVGEFTGSLIGRAAAVIGSLLLVGLGVKMIWAAWRNGGETEPSLVRFNFWGLLLLGASVSMDALSAGFTLGTRQVNLLLAAGVIGLVAGAMTAGGLVFGRFLGSRVGERAQLLGGLILVGIGIKLFF